MQEQSTDPLTQYAPPDHPARAAVSTVAAALEGMRPYQWLKNTLVFVPLIAAHRLDDFTKLRITAAVFLAFNFCASAIYLINDIRDAVAEVAKHPVGSDGWYTAVAAANLANSDHMAEEEREGLTDFRRLASLQRRHDLAVAFATFEARNYAGVTPHDRDPAEYVREAEEDLQAPAGGSLSIGSLKKS